MEKLSYILPFGLIILIFVLKLLINEKFSLEKLKRLAVETSVDVSSLGISFMISYIVALANKILVLEKAQQKNEQIQNNLTMYWNQFAEGIIILFFCIFLLVLVVFVSKQFISKYIEKDKLRYILGGVIIGYVLSLPTIVCAISLIKSIGGM